MKKEQVLLIEDDADIREGVRILLESENYCVEEAENGKQEIFSGEELDMKKEQVLLIEDDADIREGVRILLESENYCVEEAENGKSGLELLSDETDLVILDIMMPGMSGLRTCEEIRKVSNVPVLFLTAKAQESDKLIGLMAGGDDYLASLFLMQNYWEESKHFCGGTIYTEAEIMKSVKKQNRIWRQAVFGFIRYLTKCL